MKQQLMFVLNQQVGPLDHSRNQSLGDYLEEEDLFTIRRYILQIESEYGVHSLIIFLDINHLSSMRKIFIDHGTDYLFFIRITSTLIMIIYLLLFISNNHAGDSHLRKRIFTIEFHF